MWYKIERLLRFCLSPSDVLLWSTFCSLLSNCLYLLRLKAIVANAFPVCRPGPYLQVWSKKPHTRAHWGHKFTKVKTGQNLYFDLHAKKLNISPFVLGKLNKDSFYLPNWLSSYNFTLISWERFMKGELW